MFKRHILLYKVRPFQIIKLLFSSVEIGQDDVHNMVSLHRIIAAPRPEIKDNALGPGRA